MNKSELVKAVAQHADVSVSHAGPMVDAVISVIMDTLKSGDSIALLGFGTFEVKSREARKGRNPSTGAEIEIAASRSPSFKAGKSLKSAVNS
ncbi:HU family DNA-binding protein [Acidithiobacillus sp. MC6.1]|nr:HU family DNA-binding protein [Acidithiobacillus sp. MC6.1]